MNGSVNGSPWRLCSRLYCRPYHCRAQAQHYVNSGGAVDVRNHKSEQYNIKRLRSKWPKVFQVGLSQAPCKTSRLCTGGGAVVVLPVTH